MLLQRYEKNLLSFGSSRNYNSLLCQGRLSLNMINFKLSRSASHMKELSLLTTTKYRSLGLLFGNYFNTGYWFCITIFFLIVLSFFYSFIKWYTRLQLRFPLVSDSVCGSFGTSLGFIGLIMQCHNSHEHRQSPFTTYPYMSPKS